jgi:ParD-like antitoxin of type II ParDE toxin-antitoxin system
MQTGKQMVVKLSDQVVIRDVRSEAQVSDRSMAGQVEHWVKIGQAVEAILGNAEVKVLKELLLMPNCPQCYGFWRTSGNPL